MNAFVKKEIRVLLPSFGFACVLALAGLFLLDHADNWLNNIAYFTSYVFCPAVVTMLALSSFGLEVSSGTFSNLLAQPISRLKIWETKIALLAVTLLCVAILWMVTFIFDTFQNGRDHSFNAFSYQFTIVILTGLVIFSGGLWTVLLLRQVAAAFWFTLLVPGALMVIVAGLFGGGETGELFTAMTVTVLGLYSLAGFFFARWLFMRAQDVQWSGGTIVMPELRGLAWFKSAAALRKWRPRAALWRKEFQLHQSQFVMAIALAVLHGGVLVARHFVDQHKSSELYFVLENFWGLWLVMPLLVGCTAVAEERKLGTLEGQLCLPVKRRTQFGIKFIVVMSLSGLFGVVMPLLLEGIRILPSAAPQINWVGTQLVDWAATQRNWESQMSPAQLDFWILLGMVNHALPVLLLAGIAVLIGLISFYTSTLARNTLQSLAPAVLGIMVACFLMAGAFQPQQIGLGYLWHGPLPYFIGGPVILLTLLVLTFWNFKQVRTGVRMGGVNLLVIVVALALSMVMTSAVYHRAWEKFTPFEPAHGAARLSLADRVRLDVWWNETSVRLPDGKIWTASFDYNRSMPSPLAQLFGKVTARLTDGTFYGGSNWLNIRRYGREQVGVKADGTLWISEQPMRVKNLRRDDIAGWKAEEQKLKHLVQFGTETNWQSVSPTYLSTLLVKTDGSLWRLGTNRFDEKRNEWPGLRAFTPYRLGTDSDWASVDWDYYRSSLLKTNGSIWNRANNSDKPHTNFLNRLEIEPDFVVEKLYDGRHGIFRSTTQIIHGPPFRAGIRDDGTFRIWADEHLEMNQSRYGTYEWRPTDLQIGSGTHWLALAGGDEKVVTLKDDGTLWLWNFSGHSGRGWDNQRGEQEILKTIPVQLGTHSDWIAVSGHSTGLIALAADGGLWFWPVADVGDYFGSQDGRPRMDPWLQVSRKPQLIGNIFAKTE